MLEKNFKKMREISKEKGILEEQYYKDDYKLKVKMDSITDKMINSKLSELNISVGSKVVDSKTKDIAFLIGVNFRQKPSSYLKKSHDITLDDFEFTGEFKGVKKDGDIMKKDTFLSLKLENCNNIHEIQQLKE